MPARLVPARPAGPPRGAGRRLGRCSCGPPSRSAGGRTWSQRIAATTDGAGRRPRGAGRAGADVAGHRQRPGRLAVRGHPGARTTATARGGRARPPDAPSEAGIGSTIGIIERLLISALVLAGGLLAIGLVVAAKTLARFKQLDDRDFAEYYLLGTLASVTFAVVTSLVALRALA